MRLVLFTEIRRSPLRWWLPLLVAVDLGVLFGRSTDWIGIWPQASAAAQVPAWFMAPVLAAGAAWSAARIRKAGGAEQRTATALRTWRREAVCLGATLAYGLTPLALGAAAAAAVTLPDAGPGFLWPGFLWPGYLLVGAALVSMCAALGHLVGRMSQSPLVALLAAPVLVLGLIWFNPIPLPPFQVLTGPPQVETNLPALLARVVLAGAVILPAITVEPSTALASSANRYLAASRTMATLCLVIVSVIGVYTAGPLLTERPPPDQPLCSSGRLRVCVWPEHRKYLPSLATMARRLENVGDARLVVIPATVYEEHLRNPADNRRDFTLALGEWVALRGIVSQIEHETFPGTPCTTMSNGDRERFLAAEIELHEWLVARAFAGPKPADLHGGFEFDEAELSQLQAAIGESVRGVVRCPGLPEGASTTSRGKAPPAPLSTARETVADRSTTGRPRGSSLRARWALVIPIPRRASIAAAYPSCPRRRTGSLGSRCSSADPRGQPAHVPWAPCSQRT